MTCTVDWTLNTENPPHPFPIVLLQRLTLVPSLSVWYSAMMMYCVTMLCGLCARHHSLPCHQCPHLLSRDRFHPLLFHCQSWGSHRTNYPSTVLYLVAGCRWFINRLLIGLLHSVAMATARVSHGKIVRWVGGRYIRGVIVYLATGKYLAGHFAPYPPPNCQNEQN